MLPLEHEVQELDIEQQANYALFQEVTASSRDPRGALQLLRSSGWNVDRALQLHWAASSEPPATGGRASPHTGPSGGHREGPDRFAAGGEFAAPLLESSSSSSAAAEARTPPLRGAPHRCALLLARTWAAAQRCFVFILDLCQAFIARREGNDPISPDARDPGSPPGGATADLSRPLRQRLLEAYGEELQLPVFFDGSFQSALQSAQRDLKLLAVYLHSAAAPHSQQVCSNVLASELVRQLLNSSYLFWAGDVARREAQGAARMLRAREYPFLCVLLPADVDDIRILGTVSGNMEPDAAVALLTACLEDMESHRSEMLARAEQHVEDRLLREAQDREYQEALEADRLRAEKRQQEEQELAEWKKVEEEKLSEERQAQERLEAAKQQHAEELRARAAALGPEPPEAKASIALRLPAGQRIQRKFLQNATLQHVYEWAEVAAYLPENADKHLEIPERFVLKTSFPSQELVERTRSIEELRLAGTNILLAEIEDDD